MLARCAVAERLSVVFVGSGELTDKVKEITPQAGVTGWVGRGQILAYLRSSRALVFPSLWYETLGLVVLEAAANGVPGIVPDTCAAREIVMDGVTGLHFRGGDQQDLRGKMRQLRDPLVARNLGERPTTASGLTVPLRVTLTSVHLRVFTARRFSVTTGIINTTYRFWRALYDSDPGSCRCSSISPVSSEICPPGEGDPGASCPRSNAWRNAALHGKHCQRDRRYGNLVWLTGQRVRTRVRAALGMARGNGLVDLPYRYAPGDRTPERFRRVYQAEERHRPDFSRTYFIVTVRRREPSVGPRHHLVFGVRLVSIRRRRSPPRWGQKSKNRTDARPLHGPFRCRV